MSHLKLVSANQNFLSPIEIQFKIKNFKKLRRASIELGIYEECGTLDRKIEYYSNLLTQAMSGQAPDLSDITNLRLNYFMNQVETMKLNFSIKNEKLNKKLGTFNLVGTMTEIIVEGFCGALFFQGYKQTIKEGTTIISTFSTGIDFDSSREFINSVLEGSIESSNLRELDRLSQRIMNDHIRNIINSKQKYSQVLVPQKSNIIDMSHQFMIKRMKNHQAEITKALMNNPETPTFQKRAITKLNLIDKLESSGLLGKVIYLKTKQLSNSEDESFNPPSAS